MDTFYVYLWIGDYHLESSVYLHSIISLVESINPFYEKIIHSIFVSPWLLYSGPDYCTSTHGYAYQFHLLTNLPCSHSHSDPISVPSNPYTKTL